MSPGEIDTRVITQRASCRMVHFYHKISPDELFDICLSHLGELKLLLNRLLEWVDKNKPCS
jgi:hypothetical protein